MLRIKKAYPNSDDWLQLLDGKEIEDVLGVRVKTKNALWFPDGGTIDLPRLCRELLNHSNIHLNLRRPELDSRAVKVIATALIAFRNILGII